MPYAPRLKTMAQLIAVAAIAIACSLTSTLASQKVKYKGFRWDYNTWQGFSTAFIRNSHFQLEFMCNQAESEHQINLRKRQKGTDGDTAPLFADNNLLVTIAGDGRSATFEMNNGTAKPFGTMGMQALAEATDIITSSKEFSVEIPDKDFKTRFSSTDAKDAIEGVNEDCTMLQ